MGRGGGDAGRGVVGRGKGDAGRGDLAWGDEAGIKYAIL